VLMWLVRRVWPKPEAAPARPRTRRRPRPRFGSVISGRKCGRLLVYFPERIRRTRPAVAMKWHDRTRQVRQLPELGNPSRGTRPERATEMRQSKSRHNVSSSTRDGATDSAAPSASSTHCAGAIRTVHNTPTLRHPAFSRTRTTTRTSTIGRIRPSLQDGTLSLTYSRQ
jgi:hypothetical protein